MNQVTTPTDQALNFLMNSVGFGATWSFHAYDPVRIKMQSSQNGGCMIYNHEKGIIMVFNGRNPSATEIMLSETRYLALKDPNQDFVERCLEAERSAISNTINRNNRFYQPGPLFEYMDNDRNDVVVVIECVTTDHTDKKIVTWSALNYHQMEQFQEALLVQTQPDATGNQILSAQNTLAFLTGWGEAQYHIVYLKINSVGWQDVEVERPDGVDLGDQLKDMYFTCDGDHTVSFQIDPYNLGGRLRQMHSIWKQHKIAHPKCTNRRGFSNFY